MDNQDLDINKEKEDIETLEDEEIEGLDEEITDNNGDVSFDDVEEEYDDQYDNSNKKDNDKKEESKDKNSSKEEPDYTKSNYQNRFNREQKNGQFAVINEFPTQSNKVEKAKAEVERAQRERDNKYKLDDSAPNGEKNYKRKNRQDRINDRNNLREANKSLRTAQSDNFRSRIGKIRDSLFKPKPNIKSPKQKRTSLGSLSGQLLKTKSKVFSFIAKKKIALLLAASMLAVFAIVLLFFVVSEAKDSSGGGGSYRYNVDGVEINNVDIKIMGSENNVLDATALEQYARGVALYALGPDSIDNNPEALKTAIVIARSRILNDPDAKSGTIEIYNDGEMNYWNYKNDFYKLENDDGVLYSPEVTAETPNAELVYKALTEEQIEQLIRLSDTVGGVYITGDSVDNIVLDESTIQSIITKSKDSSYADYNDIIAAQYPDATVNNGEFVGYTFSGEAGEYSTWKQGDKRWGSISLGTNSGTTMAEIGCYVTSNAIAIAYLNATTTLPEFNPGTFATELKRLKTFGSGGGLDNYANVSKVVPGLTKERIYTSNLSNSERIKKVKEDAEKGYAIIMQVKCNGYNMPGCTSGTHFVVLDPITSSANKWEDLAIWNPSGKKTWAQYNRALAYYDRLIVAK